MESDEDEKKRSVDQEKQSLHEDAKFDSQTNLAPLKKKNNINIGSNTPNSKNSSCVSQQNVLVLNSQRNPYGILPIRKNSAFTNNSANNSPNMSNNGSQRNIYQYSLFSANQNTSEQKPDNNRLTLPKIEQKSSRRYSYDPQSQQALPSPQPQSSFNSSRYANMAAQQNQSSRKGSTFKNPTSQFRYDSPTQQHKINSPKFRNHAHNESLSQFNQNSYNSSHNLGYQSQNDFNVVQNYKNNSNVQLMTRQHIKMKE